MFQMVQPATPNLQTEMYLLDLGYVPHILAHSCPGFFHKECLASQIEDQMARCIPLYCVAQDEVPTSFVQRKGA
jgi:hypothetical protein